MKHYRQTDAYARDVQALTDQAASEYASLAGTLFAINTNKPFAFDDYPQTKKKAKEILTGLAKGIKAVVNEGTEQAWNYANDKNDAFLRKILNTSKLTPEEAEQYQARNLEALGAFQERKVNGMGLSERVWKQAQTIQDTIELGIDVNLGEGKSAAQLSRELRQCLKEPDKLFRRVRDKYGNLQLSKAAALYHPGQGVYRSSARNAERLARTEINMAYRTSEQQRWQQLDFVVGFRVMLSNNHTYIDSKGQKQPLKDVCDELQGDYPKTFRFVGWHPNCRCYVIPILSDYDEFNKNRANRLRAIAKGLQYKAMPSRRTANAVPSNFTNYIEDIADRAKFWKSQPYYIRDNFVGGKIGGGLKPGLGVRIGGKVNAGVPQIVKATAQPITDFDDNIAYLKEWAYALGLDVSQLDTLRQQGNRQQLSQTIKELNKDAVEKLSRWSDAQKALQAFISTPEFKAFADLYRKYFAIFSDNGGAPTRYYASSIDTLNQALVAAKAEYEKAKEEAENTPLAEFFKAVEVNKVEYKEVKTFKNQPTEAEIINRLGGGDKTKGSCSSLAFAYAGNKAGLDVLDYRDGISRKQFASRGNIMEIVSKSGGIVERDYNDFNIAHNLLKVVEAKKEYYFACGAHAAIVKQGDSGLEYLELQTTASNGWKPLTDTELKFRFGAKKSHTFYGQKIDQSACIIDIARFKNTAGFKKMLGYLNTNEKDQKKGAGGSAK